jgi:hypothetical protein
MRKLLLAAALLAPAVAFAQNVPTIQSQFQGNSVSTGLFAHSTATVTAAGNSLATATPLSAQFNTVTGTGGVALPAMIGAQITVFNSNTSGSINLYPPSGASIDNGTAGAAIGIGPGAYVRVVCVSATQCL